MSEAIHFFFEIRKVLILEEIVYLKIKNKELILLMNIDLKIL